MLKGPATGTSEPTPVKRRSRTLDRRLWHDATKTPIKLLGCPSCPEYGVCGGIQTSTELFDCSSLCCESPETCDRVCRLNSVYARRVREVGGFDLATVPRSKVIRCGSLPQFVPTVYHGTRRDKPVNRAWVGLPLYALIERKDGTARFRSAAELRRRFTVHRHARVLATGTAKDKPLERLWAAGQQRRQGMARQLLGLGVELVTTPNFSLFTDRPRWDDLHSMKRIALVFSDFHSQGLQTALHLNGRTDRDFERWAEFLGERDEITHVAYEFTTGTGWEARCEQHAQWLMQVAETVPRPLTLIMRGGGRLIPDLKEPFHQVVYLDTNAFMKTIYRQRAQLTAGGELVWGPSRSPRNSALDELLVHNIAAVERDFLQTVAEVDRSA